MTPKRKGTTAGRRLQKDLGPRPEAALGKRLREAIADSAPGNRADVRVYADNLGRIAQAEARLFHFYVHDRLRAAGLTGFELGDATRAASEAMRCLMDPTLRYFTGTPSGPPFARISSSVSASSPVAPRPSETPAELRLAIAFLDLSSFTPMTASMGDLAAAKVVERFSEIVRGGVARHHGRVLERIGDAFMLAFPTRGPPSPARWRSKSARRRSRSFRRCGAGSTSARCSTGRAATSGPTSISPRGSRTRRGVTKSS